MKIIFTRLLLTPPDTEHVTSAVSSVENVSISERSRAFSPGLSVFFITFARRQAEGKTNGANCRI